MAYNHFDYVPSGISKSRSVFKFEKAIATGAEIGYLYPMCKPITMLPGSSLKLDLAMEVRSGALIAPLQDELILDAFAFNVPNRIVWEHWKQFLGSTDDVLFDNLTEYQIPSFKYDSPSNVTLSTSQQGGGYHRSHLLACCMELPYHDHYDPDQPYLKISALPFRGYSFIWNEFFRPSSLVDPLLFSKTDDGWSGDNMNTISLLSYAFTSVFYLIAPDSPLSAEATCNGGAVLPTFRVHKSLWTSCLPKPSLETLNLLGGLTAPVGFIAPSSGSWNSAYPVSSSASVVEGEFIPLNDSVNSTVPAISDLSQALLTVNNYRETIMLQNYYDALNRSGSRYDEIIRNIFHTQTNFGVIDIPELIVHKRFIVYRKDVVATAETVDANDATVVSLGHQASYIDTVVKDSFFTVSTTEHGYIHLLYTIRPSRIRMSQGVEPDWTKLDKFSMYYPQFDGMGDVSRLKREIYLPDVTVDSNNNNLLETIFGYQEYGAEYKYQRSSAVGWCDVYASDHIPGLTLTENLSAQPVLVSTGNLFGFMSYISCLVDQVSFSRCLAISNPMDAPEFILDIRLTGEIVHPMPVYNIPGMGDLL